MVAPDMAMEVGTGCGRRHLETENAAPDSGSVRARVQAHDPLAEVWLLATPGYTGALTRLLQSIEDAGDPVRVHVRWAQDLRRIRRQII